MAVEILELANQIERVINELSEGLKTGASDGQEIKVALSKDSDRAGLLKGSNNIAKNLDGIYSDVDSKIKNMVINPALQTLSDGSSNPNFHANISTYIQTVFKDSVVNETYARVVGNSDQYPDGDKIINTFKELQELIGTSDAKAVDAATILSRLSQLNEAINTARTELQAEITASASQQAQALSSFQNAMSQAISGLGTAIEDIVSQISSIGTENDTEHSNLRAEINSARGDLEARIGEAKSYAEGVSATLESLSGKYGAFVGAVGSVNDFAVARAKLQNISIKSIWGI